jgi:aminoglycoside phosphotransferase (APT) family kinase protein
MPGGPSFVVKQGGEPQLPSTLAVEAAMYEYLWRTDPAGAIARLPRLVSYDAERDILVTESMEGSENLNRYHQRLGRFPALMGREIGRALSWVHRLENRTGAASFVSEHPPWVLGIHEPSLSSLRELSAANLRLILIIQSVPELRGALDRLRSDWGGASIVHNDLKWDNILVLPLHSGSPGARLRFVDWELAGRGDPTWDVGAALASYLEAWIFSMPVMPDQPVDEIGNVAVYPLETIRPAVGAFWNSYRSELGLSALEAHLFLLRSVRSCAARLLQTAYESSQLAGDLSASAVILVQVSANIFRQPSEAASRLFGLS